MELNFILVEPKVPENIGASARALKTMGFNSLSLVNPCIDPENRASWLAHGSLDILENASSFSKLSDALKDTDIAIATTVRKRGLQKEPILSKDIADFILQRKDGLKKVSFVFGREESGLTTDEMKLCDLSTSIEMNTKYPSLNLAQSVMIYSYELSSLVKDEKESKEISIESNSESIRTLKKKVSDILEITGTATNINLSGRIMERISLSGSKDINLMHSLSGSILKALKRKGNA